MPVDIDSEKMEEIQNSDETWVIDFWADWCKPCEKYAPTFESVSEEVEEVNFGKVDMEEHSSIGQDLGVRALPTTLIL
ncbi:MAG: thioredoxin family protein, partial [Candidatus Nanohaloarchaea archaeon]